MQDEKDITISARFIKQLPLQILDTYQRELSGLQTPDLELINYTESVMTVTTESSTLEDPVY